MLRIKTLIGGAAILAVAAVLAAPGSSVYMVMTGSMSPGLAPGDMVFCHKPAKITRGDIIAFEDPAGGSISIKRVIGLGSDHVEYQQKLLSVNGELARKDFKANLPNTHPNDFLFQQTLDQRTFEIYELLGPPLIDVRVSLDDEYFVIGDNRDDSLDSRSYGPLNKSAVRCKVMAILATEVGRGYSFRRAKLLG